MNRIIALLSVILLLGVVAAPVYGQTKDELKVQFKSREADLRDLKQKGRVGETIDGFVDPVDADASADEKVTTLVRDENKDRRRLYQILADEINADNPDAKVKATADTIAVRNAKRNIERAGKDEFLRVAKDHWIRVKDFPRFERLTRLKTQGKVGETAAGLVEVVKAEDAKDATISALVGEENTARTAEYKALAEKERVDLAAITKRMAERNFENARIGDMLKGENGAWRKK